MTDAIYTDPFHPHLIMHRVEGGTFMMGGNDDAAEIVEKPVHQVTIPAFYVGRFSVTQSLWEAVMRENPSRFTGSERPVEQVSWLDIVNKFLPLLNNLTGKMYRLPSESEWEFAARGGVKSAGYTYSGSDKLKQVGWFDENSDRETHPVGQKMANELGLYDMSGNVWEWCVDHFQGDYKGASANGIPWVSDEENARRVMRGGGFFRVSQFCRAASRNSNLPDRRSDIVGFRLALSAL